MTNAILKNAKDYCDTHKHRLTKPRREVLKIMASSTKPMGAYDVLHELEKTIHNPKPPTAYRAIEFWQKHGFIHRIESLNAYTICQADHKHKGSEFMICDRCNTVTETHMCDLPQSLQEKTAQFKFTSIRWNFEIYGVCNACTLNTA